MPARLLHVWFWATASKVPALLPKSSPVQTVGWYNRRDPIHLLTSPSSLPAYSTQILRLRFLLRREGSSQPQVFPPQQGPNILRALQIGKAIDSKESRSVGLAPARTHYIPTIPQPSLASHGTPS